MKSSMLVLVSAIAFTLIGLAAAYIALSRFPISGSPDNDRHYMQTTAILVVALPLAGAVIGIIVGIIAALVGYFADRRDRLEEENWDDTQAYPKSSSA